MSSEGSNAKAQVLNASKKHRRQPHSLATFPYAEYTIVAQPESWVAVSSQEPRIVFLFCRVPCPVLAPNDHSPHRLASFGDATQQTLDKLMAQWVFLDSNCLQSSFASISGIREANGAKRTWIESASTPPGLPARIPWLRCAEFFRNATASSFRLAAEQDQTSPWRNHGSCQAICLATILAVSTPLKAAELLWIDCRNRDGQLWRRRRGRNRDGDQHRNKRSAKRSHRMQ